MFIKIRLADLEGAKRALPRYFKILNGQETALYLKCKRLPVNADLCGSEERLWEQHNQILAPLRTTELTKKTKTSLLDLKLKLARHMLLSCELCERKCGVNRLKGKEGHTLGRGA
jgi:putative pyruvate formate lyase activating enzyme